MIRNHGKPFPASIIYPDAMFRIKGSGRRICLTFDDGPDPLSTPGTLNILKHHNVTAAFFCTGSKVARSPGLLARIAAEGHTVGNHGYSHLNGLTTPVRTYCADVLRGRDITCSNLFRPPYGRLRVRQYLILARSMRIVFWSVMPYDFDATMSSENSYNILCRRVRPGSIIVMHDTEHSHACGYLDRFIRWALDRGYSFGLPDES
jgi:peptidoglycan/xylan/chitin deacetylase (PgdA/CDA1 family)